MIDMHLFLDRLEAVRKSGKGHLARCPAHADKSPSLSIGEGDDGRILVHCHAGCSADAVVAAMGLSMTDLFPEGPRRPPIAPGVTRSELRRAADIERGILFFVNADRRKGKPISEADNARAAVARQRVTTAGRFGC